MEELRNEKFESHFASTSSLPVYEILTRKHMTDAMFSWRIVAVYIDRFVTTVTDVYNAVVLYISSEPRNCYFVTLGIVHKIKFRLYPNFDYVVCVYKLLTECCTNFSFHNPSDVKVNSIFRSDS